MVHVTRTAAIAPGKLGEAIAFAQAIVRHIHDVHGATIHVLLPVGGNPSRIAWHGSYDSMDRFIDLTEKLFADAPYMELLSKNASLFVPGSLVDDIWRTL